MQELLAVLPDWLGVYLLTVNVAAFAVYGADKLRARQGCWRVPEKTLFLLAIVGGGVGGAAGDVVLSSQDPALVLPLWHPRHSGGAVGAGGLAVAALNEHPKKNKNRTVILHSAVLLHYLDGFR